MTQRQQGNWERELQQKQSDLEQWEQRLLSKERELRQLQQLSPSPEISTRKDVGSSGCCEKEQMEKPFTPRTSFLFYFQSGRFLRPFVFGGLDGITTTMVLVCSVSGLGSHLGQEHQQSSPDEAAHHQHQTTVTMAGAAAVLALGTANAIADAFSMGMGELLSSLADGDTEGSNLESKVDAIRNALVMFISFIIFGFMPLFAYTATFGALVPKEKTDHPPSNVSTQSAFESLMLLRLRAAWFFCLFGLFSLGLLKGYVTTPSNERTIAVLSKNGVAMVLTGGIASTLSYFISMYLHMDTH